MDIPQVEVTHLKETNTNNLKNFWKIFSENQTKSSLADKLLAVKTKARISDCFK